MPQIIKKRSAQEQLQTCLTNCLSPIKNIDLFVDILARYAYFMKTDKLIVSLSVADHYPYKTRFGGGGLASSPKS